MKLKLKIKSIKKDYLQLTLFSACFSLIITFVFSAYNAYLGIKFGDAFAIGISIYYFLLFWIKTATLIVEKIIDKTDERKQKSVRIKNFIISSIFIFVIDFCLIAPIVLMIVMPKDVKFGIIPAIAIAAYTVYKITASIINYSKSKKTENPTILLLREIDVVDSLVSILTLQHTLIMVNGGMSGSMRQLSFVTSIVFIFAIILFSVLSFERRSAR